MAPSCHWAPTDALSARAAIRRCPALLVVAIAMAMLFAALPASANAAPGMTFGIEQNGGMADPIQRGESLNQMQRLGARTIRFVLRFDEIAKCDPQRTGYAATASTNPCYDFAVADAVVREADQRGIQVLLSVYGVPRWVFGRDHSYVGTTDADFARFAAAFADFTRASAGRYSGQAGLPRVVRWTIWNEPNGAYFWQPRNGDPAFIALRYARLYDASARAIKAVDSTLLVAAGPTAPMPPDLKPVVFVRIVVPELQRLGSPIDAWAHNAYMGKHDPFRSFLRSPVVGLANIGDLTAELDRATVTRGKPVWITEFGYETPPAVQDSVSKETQAEWLVDATYLAWSHPRIGAFIWYGLFDDGPAGGGPEGFQAGLFERLSQCGTLWCAKPSTGTFRHPLWISETQPLVGTTITLWAQARAGSAGGRVQLYSAVQGKWQPIASRAYGDGAAVARIRIIRPTTIMACDTTCGTPRRVQIQRGLPMRAALERGLVQSVQCTARCTITARLVLVARLTKGRTLTTRRLVVGTGSATHRRAGKRAVRIVFSKAGRQRLAGFAGAQLELQTAVTQSGARQDHVHRVALLR